uniref:Uncharacterized protein n=1 Tax=Anguilla anguilla TaxID=7936 RepID=A0A0E9PK50_ANGAN
MRQVGSFQDLPMGTGKSNLIQS